MSTFRRIFVPVDGSAPSSEAVAFATRLAAEWAAELIFAHVVDADRLVCAEVPGLDVSSILHDAAGDGRQLLGRASAAAAALGVTARTHLREGRTVETLLELAKTDAADLIAMGSHGRSGFKRLMMGSTTEALLRACRIPVLVVHAPEGAQPVEAPAAQGVLRAAF
jgi:nucleotide-binding universal stress UspA family protein